MIGMKSTKQSRHFAARALSIAISIALIFCAVFSFGFINIKDRAFAEDGEDNATKSENGIRFVQVAAGSDFAIGLTYDNKLYGWSLKENPLGNTSGTLGDYYSNTPKEIDVKFYVGPGDSGNNKWGDGVYNTQKKDSDGNIVTEKILSIAATRTTAAFITENGYVYTWGNDAKTYEGITMSESGNYLLLRSIADSYNWYEPYIINYNYNFLSSEDTAVNHALNFITPKRNAIANFTLAAGEYNYVLGFTLNSNYYTYIWGSTMYAVPNVTSKSGASPYTFDTSTTTSGLLIGGRTMRMIYSGPSVGTTYDPNMTVVAGGYNVGINSSSVANGSSLQLRGKNVLLSQYNGGFVYTYATVNENANSAAEGVVDGGKDVSSFKFGETTVTKGIIGGNGNQSNYNIGGGGNDFATGQSKEQFYGRQAVNGDPLNYSISTNNYTRYLTNAHNAAQKLNGAANTYAINYAVSLGNDIGYGISGGKLFAWGDNTQGQLNINKTTKNAAKPQQLFTSGDYSSFEFTSVAAGKQLSKVGTKAFISSATLVTESGTTSFNSAVQNEPDFITGALTTDGRLIVWSNNDGGTGTVINKPTEIVYGNATGTKDKFIAVYSGYGNHLFAVTELGKLVHISYKNGGYVQDYYDTFIAKDNTAIVNWTLSEQNSVRFKVNAEVGEKEPALGNATLYAWKAVGTENAEFNDGTSVAAYRALVETNAIGDEYRILSADDNAVKFLSVSGNNPSFAPVYTYDGKEMTPAQQKNIFTAEIVTDGNGRGLKITPLQSSNGKAVTVSLYVGRYNRAADFTSAGVDNAIYYDYKEVTFTFIIEDTPSVVHYVTYADAEGEDGEGKGNSNIPLLDPNNPYNNKYSVAVQDVTNGVDALATYFNITGTNKTTFANAIIAKMNSGDAGFPSVSKVSSGNLTYYLGTGNEATLSGGAYNYYNNKYQYLYSDRDADRIVINSGNYGVVLSGQTSAIKGGRQTINIADIDLSGYRGTTDESKAAFDKLIANFITDFNNKYGIYNVTVSDDDYKLSFSYDIVLFTADEGSTGVGYSKGSDGKADISSPITTSTSAGSPSTATVNVRTITGGPTATNATASVNNGSAALVSVFSQASLHINNGVLPGDDEHKNPVLIGQNSGGNNSFTVYYPNTIYVGNSVTLKLEDYVKNLGNTIFFTYENDLTFTAFNNQFTDETHSGVKIVNLDSKTLTITPTTAAPINLTLTVQRFADNSRTVFAGDNEKITLTFVFDKITTFSFNKNQDVTKEFTITKDETIDLFGGYINGERYNPFAAFSGIPSAVQDTLKGKITISEPISTDTNEDIFSARRNGTAITVTPKSSGTGIVQFTATVYGQSLFFSIRINVSYVTVLGDDDTVTLVKDEYVYINELFNKLKSANSFKTNIDSYKVLYNDPDAIYFTTDKYGAKGGNTEITLPSGFIKSAVFEESGKSTFIKISPSANANNYSGEYYMHVRFVTGNVDSYESAPNGSILEVILAVKSGKVIVPLNGEQQIKINVKESREKTAGGIWYTQGTGLGMTAHISAKELLDYIGETDTNNYTIFYVSADDEAANCFAYDFNAGDNEIRITPLDNTEDKTYAVNVSVYNQNRGSLMLSFDVSIDGIVTKLPVMSDESGLIGYGEIWLYSFIIVFGVLLIVFVIRMIVYWRRRAKQRAIIKRNQELIRMRDRIHNRANIASKEQVVRTKMKMEDPKYAKLFNDMRKNAEATSGITLDNSDLAATAKAKSKKKKKGGKKTVAELKAELEAKKAAFAAAQAQSAQPVNPFVSEVPIDGADFAAPDDGFGASVDDFATPTVDEKEIVFDASDLGDGM